MSSIRNDLMTTMGLILAVAIGLAVLGVVAGLTLLPTGTSAGIISATTQINAFLAIVGIGIAVGITVKALG